MPPIPLEALEGLTGRLVTLGLVHAGWVGLLVAAILSLAFQCLPLRSHRARHDLLMAAMGLIVIGPMAVVAIHRSIVAPKSLAAGVSIRVEAVRSPEEPMTAIESNEQ